MRDRDRRVRDRDRRLDRDGDFLDLDLDRLRLDRDLERLLLNFSLPTIQSLKINELFYTVRLVTFQ